MKMTHVKEPEIWAEPFLASVCQDAELLRAVVELITVMHRVPFLQRWMQVTSKTMCDGNIKERLVLTAC
jgi:hypothetical protein